MGCFLAGVWPVFAQTELPPAGTPTPAENDPISLSPTPAVSPLETPTPELTITETVPPTLPLPEASPTITFELTLATPTSEIFPSAALTITQGLTLYLPIISRQELPTITVLYCSSPGLNIPDNNSAGIKTSLFIDKPGNVTDLDIFVKIEHTWVGDLKHTRFGSVIVGALCFLTTFSPFMHS